jgi:hypothetical protein
MRLFLLTLLFAIFSCSKPSSSKNLESDLQFIYRTIVADHPGIYNEDDPNFRYNLMVSYDKAKYSLSKTKNFSKQKEIIRSFVKSLDDNHAWVDWHDNIKNLEKDKKAPSFQSIYLNPHTVWITLPTFNISNSQKQEFERIIKAIKEFKYRKAIIFDLRGNQGGNSEYGSMVVDSLFGKEYAEQQRTKYNKFVSVDWRASRDNLAYINSLFDQYKSLWLKKVREGMRLRFAQGKPFYRETFSTAYSPKNSMHHANQVTAKIFIVIDSENFSAALDFIDEIKMMEADHILIGHKTKADRLYMEVRTVDLPSGLGTFSFPIKVYRNRLRLDNQPYIPDIKYRDISNTKNLQNYIIKIIGQNNLRR